MWTDDQLQAIKAPVSDILVTAAAGSGKTAVMVERLIERILSPDGCDIDKILVVTFTKAAAAEIKERIASKIAEKLETEDSPRLKNQLVLINRASICTIHSFCLDILRGNFHLLGLDPNFKIASTDEVAMLKTRALDEVFDKHYEEDDIQFLNLVNAFTKKNDKNLCDMVMNIYNFSQSTEDPFAFLDDCVKAYDGDFKKHTDYILKSACLDAEYSLKLYEKAIKLCEFDISFDKCREVLAEELSVCENIIKLAPEGWNRVLGYINGYKFSIIRSNKNMDQSVFEEIKALREIARANLKNIIGHMIYMPIEEIEKDLKHMKPYVYSLCSLVKEFSVRYGVLKREKNIVDFNDFEHFALKLLKDPDQSEVASNLKNRYEEIYVDEYQDCNGVQEAIFKAVSRESEGAPNMFMVGDMKQCIYRFRNANPQLFKHKSDTYGLDDTHKKITLSKNFRSRETVLKGANIIFENIMSEEVGEIEYSDDEHLYYGLNYENKNPDTEFIDIDIVNASGEFAEGDDDKPAKIEAEAELVAKKIRKMIDEKYVVFDKSTGEYRPLKYRDVAILLRSRSGSAMYFEDALSKYGIPSFCDTGALYFECEEVSTLISFLKIISNPLDDINLVSVLRSHVYGFDDNELLKIRALDRDNSYYNALVKYADEKDYLAKKVQSFLKKIDSYRQLSYVMTTDEFLWHLLNDISYMEYIGTLDGAELKKANVRMFINCAREFEENLGGGIVGFADYVTGISLSGGGATEAKLIGENDDVVRIMTIHKSKGLEFPVVFLSQCGKGFMTRDLSAPVLMHHELFLGIDYVDEKKRFSYKTVVKDAIREKCLGENFSEEMRLLYVAVTRAREKLIITGVVDNYEKFAQKINLHMLTSEHRVNPKAVKDAKNFLEWVVSAVSLNEGKASMFRKTVTSIYDIVENIEHSGETQISIPEKNEHSKFKGEILKRLNWEYPYASSASLPRNVTVTEIKRILDSDENVYRMYRMPKLKTPSFAEGEEKVDFAKIGTLMHLCMEKIDLTYSQNEDTIKEEISRFVKDGILSEENSRHIDTLSIAKFFESDLGKQVVASKKVWREIPFEILVEAGEIFKGTSDDEKIVVQGMIDAYFEDSHGNIILLDYKTDRRGSLNVAEFKEKIVERYEKQMYYYEKAIRLFTSKSVHKKYIYLFDIGEAIEV